jgi:DNA-binding response OmpR family regulator
VANILVVEDELGMREWHRNLEGASHRVFAAQDGVEARSLAALHSLDAKLLGAHAALRKPVTAKTVLECVRDLSPI